MNKRYWVVCTKQTRMRGHPRSEVILGIGTIQEPFGPYRFFTVDEVVRMRREGTQFFTVGVRRDTPTEVTDFKCNNKNCDMDRHLRTIGDDRVGNNLNQLPYCCSNLNDRPDTEIYPL